MFAYRKDAYTQRPSQPSNLCEVVIVVIGPLLIVVENISLPVPKLHGLVEKSELFGAGFPRRPHSEAVSIGIGKQRAGALWRDGRHVELITHPDRGGGADRPFRPESNIPGLPEIEVGNFVRLQRSVG